MIILYQFLLVNDKEQAIPAGIGTTIELNPVNDRVTGVAVELITTTVSTVSKIVLKVLKLLYLYF